MKKLKAIFHDAATWDHVRGAAMGTAFGAIMTPGSFVGPVVCGIAGGILGEERLVETFSAAFRGRELAYAVVPARRAPQP